MTGTTGGADHCHQVGVDRGVGAVRHCPGVGMAGDTVAAIGRNTRQQTRQDSAVTHVTVTHVRYAHRQVRAGARIMTAQAWRRATGDITQGNVVCRQVYCQVLVRMTRQTGGRRAERDRIDNFLARAVVTGRTGAGTVGWYVMGGAFNLKPVRSGVTVAAQLSRGFERQIARAFGHGVPVGAVEGIIAGIVTGCAVTTGREVFVHRDAGQATVDIVTTAAGVVNLRIRTIDQWRRIAVTVTTAGAGRTGANDGHQVGVVRGIGGVGHFPGIGMAGDTVTAIGRNTRQQTRQGRCVTQITVAHMGHGHRQVRAGARIVTAHAWGRATGDITEANVIGRQVNRQILVRVTRQTVGRRAERDRINNFLARAVVTGRTGPGAIGRNVMGCAFNLKPA